MAPKCCIPGCSSNYERSIKETGYVTVFKFPCEEEKINLWLKFIPRDNWKPTKHTVVCIKHFEENDLSYVDVSIDKEGKVQEFPRHRCTLKPDAVPRIFPGLPERFNKPSKTRVDPSARRERYLKAEEKRQEEWLINDTIKSFNDFCERIQSFKDDISPKWKYCVENNLVCFYVLNCDNVPQIEVSIRIDGELRIQVCVNGVVFLPSQLSWVLSGEKLQRWSQLQNLLSRYVDCKNIGDDNSNIVGEIERIAKKYMESDVNIGLEEKVSKQLLFFFEQILLLFAKKKSYSYNTIINAFILYEQSSSFYDAIRSNILTLPHPTYMQCLTRKLSLSPTVENENRKYLISACTKLSERERYVVVQLDEIYIQERLSFCNGNITGFAENRTETCAKTVQAFMISSAFGHFKEVVGLFPVRNLTGAELLDLTLKVLTFVTNCGFHVLIVISDNNRLNRNMFVQLQEVPSVDFNTPFSKYTFDFVHIFKCIRNNWLNLKDLDKTFVVPDFDMENHVVCAKFSEIRDLYKSEMNKLVKTAPKLNHKTVYPNNLERQKVKLVDNVFHETTLSALKSINRESGTVKFVEIVHKWWKVVNIRSPLKGILKRNSLETPFTSVDDERLWFLRKFLKWLEKWEGLSKSNNGHGFLTKDTFAVLHHATKTLVEIIVYALETLGIPYVLSGKFETDGLEKRFSSYRQMSGANFNISVQQILDSEKKLRVRNQLGLNSAKYGAVKFNVVSLDCGNDDATEDVFVDQDIVQSIANDYFYQEFDDVDMSALVYVSGYVSHKILKLIDCDWCSLYVAADITTDAYFNDLNRGGLSVPSEKTLELGMCMFKVLQILISPKYENTFLDNKNQKKYYINLCSAIITLDEELVSNTICNCGMSSMCIANLMMPYFANILINNYIKLRNDHCNKNRSGQKRKLITLL